MSGSIEGKPAEDTVDLFCENVVRRRRIFFFADENSFGDTDVDYVPMTSFSS